MINTQKNIRIRVAGLIFNEGKLLLISHKKNSDVYWLLPGGGVNFGESLEEALIREFKEELNISISVSKLAFICDSIFPTGDRHIVNIIFYCSYNQGEYMIGDDERLFDFRFFSKDELADTKIFPPINNNLVSIMENNNTDIYMGKMWLEK